MKNKRKIFKGYSLVWQEFSTKDRISFLTLIFMNIVYGVFTLIPIQFVSMYISKITGSPIYFAGIDVGDISYLQISIFAILFLVIDALLDIFRQYFHWRFVCKFVYRMKKIAFNWALTPRKFMNLKHSTGDISYRIMSETEYLYDLLEDPFTNFFYQITAMITAIVYLSAQSYINTIILLVSVIILCLNVWFRNTNTLPQTAERAKITAKVNNYVIKSVNNIPQIIINEAANIEKEDLKTRLKPIEKNYKHRHTIIGIYWTISNFIIALTVIAIMAFSINNAIAGIISASELLIVFNYIYNGLTPISDFGWRLGNIEIASNAVERIWELKPKKEDIISYKEISVKNIDKIELKNVSVKYNSKNKIENVNAVFNKNEIAVLTGASGQGKSTIAKLLAGLVEKNSGKILVDGKITKSMFSYLHNISFVFQEPYIFNLNLQQNIAYPERKFVYHSTLFKFLRIDQLQNKKELSENFDNNSLALSGGEQKRICLARALKEDKQIYILDEPTNDLDKAIVENLLSYLQTLKKGHIIVIVSHDKRIIDIADKIYKF